MDTIQITIFKNIFQSICDEMGKILQYSAFSANIKERKDFSCALFNPTGESFAFGTHIPVHLGAMPLSVQVTLKEIKFNEGDMVILNDPYRGGTHLPDITLIAPVFFKNKLSFFVANRAHHSDVGGMKAGSMPLSEEIFQEGLIIPPLKLIKRNEIDEEILSIILANVRSPMERRGDLLSQIAANKRGINRIEDNIKKYGYKHIADNAKFLINYSEKIFKSFIKEIPDGEYTYEDVMDDDGFSNFNIKIKTRLIIKGDQITLDFSGSDPQVKGGINTNEAITYSAALYVLTALIDEDIPINSGIMRTVDLNLPKHTIVNADKPAGLAGGNVETSQRIVDVILGVFSKVLPGRIPASSQGTMNNISFGGTTHSYYETLGGGCGAGPGFEGESAVHSHMTNSLNTPIEAMEIDFPIQILKYAIRKNSGGKGKYQGGDGLIRSYCFLTDSHLSILSERRKNPPKGILGGLPGKTGKNLLIRNGISKLLGSKVNLDIKKGDILTIKTPGGGGYGEKS